MPEGLLWNYVTALAVVGLLLLGLYSVVSTLARGRIVSGSQKHLVSVIASTVLSQHTTLHVVKVGSRYFLVGGGSGNLAMLSELPSNEVEPWIDEQRATLTRQTDAIAGVLRRMRLRR